jgi:hypothetical protein
MKSLFLLWSILNTIIPIDIVECSVVIADVVLCYKIPNSVVKETVINVMLEVAKSLLNFGIARLLPH